eukprot:5887459-Prymnesium_polylepis.2
MVRGAGVRERSERGFLGSASVASGFFCATGAIFWRILQHFSWILTGFVCSVESSLRTHNSPGDRAMNDTQEMT